MKREFLLSIAHIVAILGYVISLIVTIIYFSHNDSNGDIWFIIFTVFLFIECYINILRKDVLNIPEMPFKYVILKMLVFTMIMNMICFIGIAITHGNNENWFIALLISFGLSGFINIVGVNIDEMIFRCKKTGEQEFISGDINYSILIN